MKTRIEEIISKYIDDLNAGTAQPVDVFLAQFSDLSPRMVTGLSKILKTLTVLGNQLAEEEENLAGWQSLAGRMSIERDTDEEAIPSLAASSTSPTVGEYLSQTLVENPTALNQFAIPREVLLNIARDDSPLEAVRNSPEQRFRFAQRYAAQDQSLLRQIGGLLTHLSHLWLSGTMRPSKSPSYARPAPHEPSSN
jgi:hypothetical protein